MNVAVKKKDVASGAKVDVIRAQLAEIKNRLDVEYKCAQAQYRQEEEDAIAQMEAMAVRTLDLARAEWSKKESRIAETVSETEDSLRDMLMKFRSDLERCCFDDIVSSFVSRAILSDSRSEEDHS